MAHLQASTKRVLPYWWALVAVAVVLAVGLGLMLRIDPAYAAVGFEKGVYRTDQDKWTAGNAGNAYRENDWAAYTYAITGLTEGTGVPDFNVMFNHYQSTKNAVFIDAFANFRVCFNCPALPDGTFAPPESLADWKEFTPKQINKIYLSSTNTCTDNNDTGTPSAEHCFRVEGADLLSALDKEAADLGTSGSTIRIYYQAHLAPSFIWQNEDYKPPADFCDFIDANLHPTATLPGLVGTAYGCDVYGAVSGSYNGLGFASGSSRNFKLQDQALGGSVDGSGSIAQGAVTLPIPGVPAPAPTATLRIVKVTVNNTGSFDFTGTGTGVTANFTLTTPGTPQADFVGIATGTKQVFETHPLPAGWTLTGRTCEHTSGGAKAHTLVTAVDGVSLGVQVVLSGGEDITCTFTDTFVADTALATTPLVYPNDSATVSAAADGPLAGTLNFRLYGATVEPLATALANCQAGGTQGLLYEENVTVAGASPQTHSTSNYPPNANAHAIQAGEHTVYWRVTYTSTNLAQNGRNSHCLEWTAVTNHSDPGPGTAP